MLFDNNKIYSATGYAPNHIIKSLSSKIKNNQENIKEGCFILLSNNFYKKSDVYFPSNKKSIDEFIIPGIYF